MVNQATYLWFRSVPGEVTPTILFCGQIVYSTVVHWSSGAEPEILFFFETEILMPFFYNRYSLCWVFFFEETTMLVLHL